MMILPFRLQLPQRRVIERRDRELPVIWWSSDDSWSGNGEPALCPDASTRESFVANTDSEIEGQCRCSGRIRGSLDEHLSGENELCGFPFLKSQGVVLESSETRGSRPFRASGFNVIGVLGCYPRLSPLAPLGLEDDGGYEEGLPCCCWASTGKGPHAEARRA